MRGNKSVSVKLMVVLLAVVLLIGGSVGGTLAWLMSKTDPVVNTFTTADVSIKLEETMNTDTDGDEKADAWQAAMIPGTEITKDPTVTVLKGSEACWLFIKIEESDGDELKIATDDIDTNATYIKYTVADGWIPLDGETGVYYREHPATPDADGASISVLNDNKVYIPETVTKEMMTSAGDLKLTFTAYAVQKAGINDAADAWNQAKTLDKSGT